MNWFEYWIGHCWMSGWQSIKHSFQNWGDLMTDNYADYALLEDDNPSQECYNWFWASINIDETYSKEFLEYLQDMVDRIDRGEEKVIPFEDVKQLFEDNHD